MVATASSFSFQPWTRNNLDEESLKDILGRLNFERGHFRDITEASLQEEIAAEGGLDLSESDSGEDDGDEDGEQSQLGTHKPTSREELIKTKYEMLASISAAEQEILYSLDFVSLLISKDAPRQGQGTMSQALKQVIPPGTLGVDIWQRMPADKAREAQDELLATNVRMQGLQQSADHLFSAASRLESNVRKETQYWNEVLSISEKGWNVCRIPGQQHRLGVSFGFSESAPAFNKRSVAELLAGSGGNIMLQSALGSNPKCLVATICKDRQIVGMSKLSQVLDQEETTLEARIRAARDSLFDEELYHETVRESRTIASLGVSMSGSAIVLAPAASLKSETQVTLDLVSLDEPPTFDSEWTSEDGNALANAIVLATRLLLSQAHRDKLKARSGISAPLSDKKDDARPPLPILRPTMSFVMHYVERDWLNLKLSTMSSLLNTAGVGNTHELADLLIHNDSAVVDSDTLISTLKKPWVSNAKLKVKSPSGEEAVLEVAFETTLGSGFGMAFVLTQSLDTRQVRCGSIEEVMEATDLILASVLTRFLAQAMGEGWQSNEKEAQVFKDGRSGEKPRTMSVSFQTEERMLSLSSSERRVTWSLNADSSGQSIWEAAQDVLNIHK